MDSNELNIPSTVKDPHYRYKMPKIQTAIQGAGNGIKTNWVNLPDVSNALKVPVAYPLKFIGRELGSNTELKQNSYLINGSHPVEKMQELLDKFIKKYVLCPKCHLPEIHGKIKVTKKDIKSTCRSCGATEKLDNVHDFATYIRRNPPKYEEDDKVEGQKVTQEKEKEKKADKKTAKKIDKELKKNIKECCINLPKIIKDNEPIDKNIEEIKKFIGKYKFNLDIKFYCFSFGIIPEEVYTKSFEHRLPIIKHFIEKESDNNPEESLFYFLIGLEDNIFSRQKGENKQYISSLLYYLYDRDILSEEFWLNYLNGKIQEKYQSMLYAEEADKQMKQAALDFSNWIEKGPYEGEEEEKKEKEKNEDDKKEDDKKGKKEDDKKDKKEEDLKDDEEELIKGKKKKKKKNKKGKEKEKKIEEKEEKEEKDEKEEKGGKEAKEEKKEEKEEIEDKKEDEIDIDGI